MFDRAKGWTTTYFLRLHEEPLIYVIYGGNPLLTGFELCLKDARSRPFHVLVHPTWWIPSLLSQYEAFARTIALISPDIGVTFMCNNKTEVNLLHSKRLSAIHVHPNAFIDNSIFFPRPELEKSFQAIYIGAMVEFKRHQLAWNIGDMCVVTYRHYDLQNEHLIRNYKSLKFTNLKEDGAIEYLEPEETARLICKSYCGLILSEIEGQNSASGEYQFCGIPVISTPSRGGRDDFFDSNSTIIVNPHEQDVQKAVDRVLEDPPDPFSIRRRTMKMAIEHRENLILWMSQIAETDLRSKADGNGWLPAFKDKLREIVPCLPETERSELRYR